MENSNNYRVTQVAESCERYVTKMDEFELQRFRAKRLRTIRKEELHLSQKLLADAIGVKLRSLQDWAIGRSPMPKAVEILMNLMREIPDVKERLLSATK